MIQNAKQKNEKKGVDYVIKFISFFFSMVTSKNTFNKFSFIIFMADTNRLFSYRFITFHSQPSIIKPTLVLMTSCSDKSIGFLVNEWKNMYMKIFFIHLISRSNAVVLFSAITFANSFSSKILVNFIFIMLSNIYPIFSVINFMEVNESEWKHVVNHVYVVSFFRSCTHMQKK